MKSGKWTVKGANEAFTFVYGYNKNHWLSHQYWGRGIQTCEDANKKDINHPSGKIDLKHPH